MSSSSQRVLILYYSFSGQTSGLLQRLAAGLRHQGLEVCMERLTPIRPLRFPLRGIPATLRMMLLTFLRRRTPINELSAACFGDFELCILAGPTWSYNPSGPVLSLLDRDGDRLLAGRTVLPLISCRGYWRTHAYTLRRRLLAAEAQVPNLMVFTHPCAEPWRTIGVFCKLAGRSPEKSRLLGKYYRRFGHSREQQQEAYRFGLMIGEALRSGSSLSTLDFRSLMAMP